MSVRRLSAEQPDSFAFSKESQAKVDFWLAKYPHERRASAVIPLLWIAQKQENWISEPAMRVIAQACDMFNLAPTGEHLIQVCGTTPCWLRGADGLKAVCEKKIGPKGRDHVSADGKLAWEEVECLGACANAPMVQISNTEGDLYYEDLTPEALEQMLDDLVAGKDVKAGPISGRHCSEPTQAKVKVLEDAALYDGSRAAAIDLLPNTDERKSDPEPSTKRPSNARAKTKAKTGPSTAKPAPKDKAETAKPKAARPKTPKRKDD